MKGIKFEFSEKEVYRLISNKGSVIITDEKVGKLYPNLLLKIPRFEVPEGEVAKSLECYSKAVEFLALNNFTKSDVIIAFGGGAVTDFSGFVASTYMRGAELFLIPTTLLAMADAAIGGKCALNFGGIKNLIGSFYLPKKTFIDTKFLETLPKDEFKSAISEIIKIAMVCDSGLVEDLLGENSIDKLLKRAVELKLEVVKRDFHDRGIRHLLNYGHTFGHAIEAKYKIKHGFAVALGMVEITKWAVKRGKTDNEVLAVLLKLLEKYEIPAEKKTEGLFDYILRDKKLNGELLSIVYPKNIGEGTIEEIAPWLLKFS